MYLNMRSGAPESALHRNRIYFCIGIVSISVSESHQTCWIFRGQKIAKVFPFVSGFPFGKEVRKGSSEGKVRQHLVFSRGLMQWSLCANPLRIAAAVFQRGNATECAQPTLS